jgi:two-component system nitrogen regulation sensor histidine kinase NtrY
LTRQSLFVGFTLLSALFGALTAFKVTQSIQPDAIVEKISHNLQQYISKVDQEANRILPVLQDDKQLPNSEFQFLLLKNDTIVSWNDYHFIPPDYTLTEEFQFKFLKANNGEFLLKKWKVSNDKSLVCVLPLHTRYKVTNDYLTPYWNPAIFEKKDVVILDPNESQGYLISIQQTPLFKFLPIAVKEKADSIWSAVTIALFSLTIICLLILLLSRINSFGQRKPELGFIVVLFLMVAVRALMIFLDFPGRFTGSPLFDPKNFASSELNPSMGDLLLNSVATFIISFYFVKNYYRFSVLNKLFSSHFFGKLFSTICVISILFGMLFPFVVIQTIYNNSTITLSIAEAINFDSLRTVALLSVLLAWVSSFFFIHVFIRFLIQKNEFFSLILCLVAGCFIFIVINKLSGQNYQSAFVTGVIYLVFVLVFGLYTSLRKFQYATFVYFFVALVCLSLNGMIAIRHFEQQRNVKRQLRLAGNFLTERDYFGEYLLHEAVVKIKSDAFIQSRMANPLLRKEIVKQKIRQVSLSGYFNRYNVEVFIFGPTGESLIDSDTAKFSDLLGRYDKDSFKTEYSGVYSVTNPDGYFSQKYVAFIPIQKAGNIVGHVVIELVLKRVIPRNVYPELLVDNRFQQLRGVESVSFAVVSGAQIQYSAGNFNYESFVQNSLGNSQLYSDGIIKDKFLHVAIKDANDRIAIASSPNAPPLFWFADFSFQIILGISLILILLIVQGIFNYSLSRSLYLSARIQLIFNMAFFLPLIAVSVITISLITRSSREQLTVDFLSKANSFGRTVGSTLSGSINGEFESKFTELAALANLDANVFSPSGRLIATSQPLIFENNLLSSYVNPIAFKRISNGDKAFVLAEQVGDLRFFVAYSVLTSEFNGEHLGILTIPFFQSASSLEKVQITILSNILSIFTLVFLVLLIVSFLVTRWLTAPLRLITETMGRVSLTQVNKPLHWESNDEIGLLAREYNQMLLKLNDSKNELERNQRERAWREIAQQVAHEIKNPLTPMKLTLQQLERTLQNAGQGEEKVNRAVSMLLAQVNSLDDIASSFSTFAKMPEPIMANVELTKLLNDAIALHRHEGSIIFESAFANAVVLADGQLLKRIFSNLLLNGFQAARSGTEPLIRVQLLKKNAYYQIEISDNGRGIDEKLVDKIFLPHFTTKQSGSGLGLAIAKQGIEQMNGKIWFKTSAEGTTFFIELPKE